MSRSPPLLLSILLIGCSDPDGAGRLTLVTEELPWGQVGEAYEARLAGRGGRAPLRFSVTSGELPPGLLLDPEGSIEGTPAEPGLWIVEMTVADARGERATGFVSISIGPPDLRLITALLPAAGLDVAYQATLEAEGGRPPYAWSIAAGALPLGLELDGASGAVAGTATAAGVSDVRIAVEDAAGLAESRSYRIEVAPAPAIVTVVLPIAVVGRPYAAAVETSGGAVPAVLEVWSGTLPQGLELDADGVVRGTPARKESRPVRLRVTDAAGQIAERRIRLFVVEDEPYESFAALPLPPTCGRQEPLVVRAPIEVPVSGMIARVELALDVDYEDVGMLDVALVAPDSGPLAIHVGGGRIGGGRSLHFLYESDRASWGSFSSLVGSNPGGTWEVAVTLVPDPGFGCVAEPGLLSRVAVVLGLETSPDDYLRVSGFSPNNLIDGAFARISGGGLDQSSLDLGVELWSTGDNRIPEGGRGDDVLQPPPDLAWSTDLPPDIGTVDLQGHFTAGPSTGQGVLTGTGVTTQITVPIDVVPPDWVP